MTNPLLPSPPWHVKENRAGLNSLHAPVARLGRNPASPTTYRLSDALRELAELESAGVPLPQTAIVKAVARTFEGAWRLQVACPRCGALHVHMAGTDAAPKFGPRNPPCGGRPYHLRIDC